jgi:hypothetical protein
MIGKAPPEIDSPHEFDPLHRQAVMFPVSGELRTVSPFGCRDGGRRRDAGPIRYQEFDRSETVFGR